ncbi:MAG: hypothetical protein KDF65_06150, partial [Anaerolineae bacterium]|nr:hypothetical protein [Anaerolineae bacterium]
GDDPAQTETLAALLQTAAALDRLQPVELPAPESRQADRAAFLAQLEQLPRPQAVSVSPLERLKAWLVHHLPNQLPSFKYQRKEHFPMFPLMIKAALAFTLIFGSMGGTAVLAANSLPDSALYPLKMTLEQARLGLADAPADQAALHLAFAQERTHEMEQLALRGDSLEEAGFTALQRHLNAAFSLAAELPEPAMLGLLSQTQQMVQTQTELLTQAQSEISGPQLASLQQASQLLDQVGQEAEAGLQDPLAFRLRHGPAAPVEPPLSPATVTPKPPVTPPGPCQDADCEPAGDQNQNQHQNQNQNGPKVTLTPAATQTAPCDGDDCEPADDQKQDQYQHQNGPRSTVTPAATQTDSCDGDDCEPAGDQNQHQNQNGPQSTVTPAATQTGACNGDGCDQLPDQDQDQDRDRDQSQDQDPEQDRDRDQDQTHDHDQDQTQDQDRDQTQDHDPEQDRDRDQDQDGSGSGPADDSGNNENGSEGNDDSGSSDAAENSGGNDGDSRDEGSDGGNDSSTGSDSSGGDSSNSSGGGGGSNNGGNSGGGGKK